MQQEFDSIVFEAKLNDVWTDITSDVLISPAPAWNMGIIEQELDSVCGDPEYLTFYLDNSTGNSAGTLGYYSPSHTSVRSGWGTGTQVRLKFTYEGQTFYKFAGWVAPPPDGINVEPGQYKTRRVKVVVEGFMARCARSTMDLVPVGTNQRINQAVTTIIASMDFSPHSRSTATGRDQFDSVFIGGGSRTKVITEFYKLAVSEWGQIYTRGNATNGMTLVTNKRGDDGIWLTGSGQVFGGTATISKGSDESSFLLAEDGTFLLAEDGTKLITNDTQTIAFTDADYQSMESSEYKNIYNNIKISSYPYQQDATATTVLFSLDKAFSLAASTTKEDYRGSYKDPSSKGSVNGTAMVTPVSGTDYAAFENENGSGADYTADLSVTAVYGSNEVSYTLQNTSGAHAIWITKLQARGKGIYTTDPVVATNINPSSIAAIGERTLDIDMAYQSKPTLAENLQQFLSTYGVFSKTTIDSITILANKSSRLMYAFLQLEPITASIDFSEVVTGVQSTQEKNHHITGYSARIIDGKFVECKFITREKPNATITWA